MSGSRGSFLVGVAVGVVLVTVAFLQQRAQAEDPRTGGVPGTYTYHPRGSQGNAELCDTRTGAVYRRTVLGNWELFAKPPE